MLKYQFSSFDGAKLNHSKGTETDSPTFYAFNVKISNIYLKIQNLGEERGGDTLFYRKTKITINSTPTNLHSY